MKFIVINSNQITMSLNDEIPTSYDEYYEKNKIKISYSEKKLPDRLPTSRNNSFSSVARSKHGRNMKKSRQITPVRSKSQHLINPEQMQLNLEVQPQTNHEEGFTVNLRLNNPSKSNVQDSKMRTMVKTLTKTYELKSNLVFDLERNSSDSLRPKTASPRLQSKDLEPTERFETISNNYNRNRNKPNTEPKYDRKSRNDRKTENDRKADNDQKIENIRKAKNGRNDKNDRNAENNRKAENDPKYGFDRRPASNRKYENDRNYENDLEYENDHDYEIDCKCENDRKNENNRKYVRNFLGWDQKYGADRRPGSDRKSPSDQKPKTRRCGIEQRIGNYQRIEQKILKNKFVSDKTFSRIDDKLSDLKKNLLGTEKEPTQEDDIALITKNIKKCLENFFPPKSKTQAGARPENPKPIETIRAATASEISTGFNDRYETPKIVSLDNDSTEIKFDKIIYACPDSEHDLLILENDPFSECSKGAYHECRCESPQSPCASQEVEPNPDSLIWRPTEALQSECYAETLRTARSWVESLEKPTIPTICLCNQKVSTEIDSSPKTRQCLADFRNRQDLDSSSSRPKTYSCPPPEPRLQPTKPTLCFCRENDSMIKADSTPTPGKRLCGGKEYSRAPSEKRWAKPKATIDIPAHSKLKAVGSTSEDDFTELQRPARRFVPIKENQIVETKPEHLRAGAMKGCSRPRCKTESSRSGSKREASESEPRRRGTRSGNKRSACRKETSRQTSRSFIKCGRCDNQRNSPGFSPTSKTFVQTEEHSRIYNLSAKPLRPKTDSSKIEGSTFEIKQQFTTPEFGIESQVIQTMGNASEPGDLMLQLVVPKFAARSVTQSFSVKSTKPLSASPRLENGDKTEETSELLQEHVEEKDKTESPSNKSNSTESENKLETSIWGTSIRPEEQSHSKSSSEKSASDKTASERLIVSKTVSQKSTLEKTASQKLPLEAPSTQSGLEISTLEKSPSVKSTSNKSASEKFLLPKPSSLNSPEVEPTSKKDLTMEYSSVLNTSMKPSLNEPSNELLPKKSSFTEPKISQTGSSAKSCYTKCSYSAKVSSTKVYSTKEPTPKESFIRSSSTKDLSPKESLLKSSSNKVPLSQYSLKEPLSKPLSVLSTKKLASKTPSEFLKQNSPLPNPSVTSATKVETNRTQKIDWANLKPSELSLMKYLNKKVDSAKCHSACMPIKIGRYEELKSKSEVQTVKPKSNLDASKSEPQGLGRLVEQPKKGSNESRPNVEAGQVLDIEPLDYEDIKTRMDNIEQSIEIEYDRLVTPQTDPVQKPNSQFAKVMLGLLKSKSEIISESEKHVDPQMAMTELELYQKLQAFEAEYIRNKNVEDLNDSDDNIESKVICWNDTETGDQDRFVIVHNIPLSKPTETEINTLAYAKSDGSSSGSRSRRDSRKSNDNASKSSTSNMNIRGTANSTDQIIASRQNCQRIMKCLKSKSKVKTRSIGKPKGFTPLSTIHEHDSSTLLSHRNLLSAGTPRANMRRNILSELDTLDKQFSESNTNEVDKSKKDELKPPKTGKSPPKTKSNNKNGTPVGARRILKEATQIGAPSLNVIKKDKIKDLIENFLRSFSIESVRSEKDDVEFSIKKDKIKDIIEMFLSSLTVKPTKQVIDVYNLEVEAEPKLVKPKTANPRLESVGSDETSSGRFGECNFDKCDYNPKNFGVCKRIGICNPDNCDCDVTENRKKKCSKEKCGCDVPENEITKEENQELCSKLKDCLCEFISEKCTCNDEPSKAESEATSVTTIKQFCSKLEECLCGLVSKENCGCNEDLTEEESKPVCSKPEDCFCGITPKEGCKCGEETTETSEQKYNFCSKDKDCFNEKCCCQRGQRNSSEEIQNRSQSENVPTKRLTDLSEVSEAIKSIINTTLEKVKESSKSQSFSIGSGESFSISITPRVSENQHKVCRALETPSGVSSMDPGNNFSITSSIIQPSESPIQSTRSLAESRRSSDSPRSRNSSVEKIKSNTQPPKMSSRSDKLIYSGFANPYCTCAAKKGVCGGDISKQVRSSILTEDQPNRNDNEVEIYKEMDDQKGNVCQKTNDPPKLDDNDILFDFRKSNTNYSVEISCEENVIKTIPPCRTSNIENSHTGCKTLESKTESALESYEHSCAFRSRKPAESTVCVSRQPESKNKIDKSKSKLKMTSRASFQKPKKSENLLPLPTEESGSALLSRVLNASTNNYLACSFESIPIREASLAKSSRFIEECRCEQPRPKQCMCKFIQERIETEINKDQSDSNNSMYNTFLLPKDTQTSSLEVPQNSSPNCCHVPNPRSSAGSENIVGSPQNSQNYPTCLGEPAQRTKPTKHLPPNTDSLPSFLDYPELKPTESKPKPPEIQPKPSCPKSSLKLNSKKGSSKNLRVEFTSPEFCICDSNLDLPGAHRSYIKETPYDQLTVKDSSYLMEGSPYYDFDSPYSKQDRMYLKSKSYLDSAKNGPAYFESLKTDTTYLNPKMDSHSESTRKPTYPETIEKNTTYLDSTDTPYMEKLQRDILYLETRDRPQTSTHDYLEKTNRDPSYLEKSNRDKSYKEMSNRERSLLKTSRSRLNASNRYAPHLEDTQESYMEASNKSYLEAANRAKYMEASKRDPPYMEASKRDSPYRETSQRDSPYVETRDAPYVETRNAPYVETRNAPYVETRNAPYMEASKRESPYMEVLKRDTESSKREYVETSNKGTPYLEATNRNMSYLEASNRDMEYLKSKNRDTVEFELSNHNMSYLETSTRPSSCWEAPQQSAYYQPQQPSAPVYPTAYFEPTERNAYLAALEENSPFLQLIEHELPNHRMSLIEKTPKPKLQLDQILENSSKKRSVPKSKQSKSTFPKSSRIKLKLKPSKLNKQELLHDLSTREKEVKEMFVSSDFLSTYDSNQSMSRFTDERDSFTNVNFWRNKLKGKKRRVIKRNDFLEHKSINCSSNHKDMCDCCSCRCKSNLGLHTRDTQTDYRGR